MKQKGKDHAMGYSYVLKEQRVEPRDINYFLMNLISISPLNLPLIIAPKLLEWRNYFKSNSEEALGNPLIYG